MTIAEKSTADDVDYAQIALEKYGVSKCKVDGVFHCWTIDAGEKSNIYIFDDNGDKVHNSYFRWSDNTIVETETQANAEVAFKAFIDAQELIPVPTTVVTFEKGV